MKTRNYFNIFAIGAAVTMVLGGCTKEIENPEGPAADDAPVVTVVTAGIADADTKTYMSDAYTVGEGEDAKTMRKVYWEDGDKISINGTESVALSGVEENASTAAFKFTEAPGTPYVAVYPESIWRSQRTDLERVTVNLPDAYNSVHEGKASFAQNALPMVAYAAEGGNLTFKHLCAVLKLQIKGTDEITKVEFRGNNGEKVNGGFNVYYTREKLEFEYSGTSDAEKVVTVNVGKTLQKDVATEVYVIVPVVAADTYSNGFTVKIYDANGHSVEKAMMKPCEFKAGLVAVMPEFTYDPTLEIIEDGTAEHPWRIGTPGKWNEIATDWNNATPKKYQRNAYYELTADIDFDGVSFVNTIRDYRLEGTIDGKGHKLMNVTINSSDNRVGFITAIDKNCVIKDLIVENAKITGATSTSTSCSGFVGTVYGGTIENVTFSGDVTGANGVGGICGNLQEDGKISNCVFVSGTITATNQNGSGVNNLSKVGSICGFCSGTIENCTVKESTLEITSSSNPGNIGGICGYAGEGKVSGCKVEKCTITAKNGLYSGGICGYAAVSISDCTVGTCTINAAGNASGGISGANVGGISDCTVGKCTITGSGTRSWGGICGYAAANVLNSIVDDFEMTTNTGFYYMGGVCGRIAGDAKTENSTATNVYIVNCGAKAKINCPGSANRYFIGGVAGENSGGKVINCYSWVPDGFTPGANRTSTAIGGVCGLADDGGVVENCYTNCSKAQSAGTSKPTQHGCGIGTLLYNGKSTNFGNSAGTASYVYVPANPVENNKTDTDSDGFEVISNMTDGTLLDKLNANVNSYTGTLPVKLKNWVAGSDGYPVFVTE